MDIIFYKLQNEVNDVKKTRTLTATSTYTPLTVSGTLKSQASKINPMIDFAKDITYFSGYNYCYIADFGRYYFVDDMISVRTGITTISFRVDVLTSFLTQANITGIEGFVGRCNNENYYDIYIPDKLVQFNNKNVVNCSEPTSIYPNNAENITFNISTNLTGNVVLSAYNYKENTYPISSITVPTALESLTKTQTLKDDLFQPKGNCMCYILNTFNYDIQSIMFAMGEAPNYIGFIYNLIAFPFSIPNTTGNTKYPVKINDTVIPNLDPSSSSTSTTIDVPCATRYNSGFLILKDFRLTLPAGTSGFHSGDFIEREPYTLCEVFLPFAGWTKVSIKDNFGDRLMVLYDVNYLTGDATVYLYNQTKNVILYQTTAQLGISYSMSVTNASENRAKEQNYMRNFLLGGIGGMALGVIGSALGNPMAGIGSVANLYKSGIDFIANNNILLPQGTSNVANSSASSGVFGGLKVLVKFTQMKPSNYYINDSDNSAYQYNLGLPTNKVLKLSDIQVSGQDIYCEITDLHTTTENGLYSIGDITYNEVEELKRLCADGIYL